jgi:transcriptional regulator with XRE-family HTH domain
MTRTRAQGGWPVTGFGSRLLVHRQKAQLTQAQVAERAGVAMNTVARIERNEQEPAWPLVLAIAKALGCTPNDFLGENGADHDQESRPGRGRPRKVRR